MAIAGYNADIVHEAGASVLQVGDLAEVRLQSGASLIVDSGASVHTFGTQSIVASGMKLGADVASSGVIGVFEIMDFGNGVKFFLARTQNAPSAAGSPGSLMLRLPGTGTPGSAVDFYIKRGDNSPASGNWVAFQTTASPG